MIFIRRFLRPLEKPTQATVIKTISRKRMGRIEYKTKDGLKRAPAALYMPDIKELPVGTEVKVVVRDKRVCFVVPIIQG